MIGSVDEAAIDEAFGQFGVPGASWAVIADGRIAQTGVSGVQTADERRPVTSTTRFQACSISKPVVALAMLRLVDQGVLDLDADRPRCRFCEGSFRRIRPEYEWTPSPAHNSVTPGAERSRCSCSSRK
ncbi:serine hydrolase domain-containing protein [Nocardia yamanashiensis]|uniref:serine hydrolase domain-containing protein n=1 Tax=Nocardia yamanashiensis TaxID=209247 RepID=UPI001C3F9BF3